MICNFLHPPSYDNPHKEIVYLSSWNGHPNRGPFEWSLLDPVIFATPPKGIWRLERKKEQCCKMWPLSAASQNADTTQALHTHYTMQTLHRHQIDTAQTLHTHIVCGVCVVTLHSHCTDKSQALPRHYTDNTQTLHRHYTDNTQTLHRHYTHTT